MVQVSSDGKKRRRSLRLQVRYRLRLLFCRFYVRDRSMAVMCWLRHSHKTCISAATSDASYMTLVQCVYVLTFRYNELRSASTFLITCWLLRRIDVVKPIPPVL